MEGSVMNAGEGPKSYAQNSAYQGSTTNSVKSIIEDEISTKLDVRHLSFTSPNRIAIADFGSSTGHNTFRIVQTIADAIKKNFEKEGLQSQTPDFQVFFNDLAMNDFNTLFSTLPPQRYYYAAGVPGPFHGRLFPKGSLHFAHSSWSLQWLSEVPKALVDETSPAWNKGKISYYGAKDEVLSEYSSQFAKDIESFLEARAEELVGGGLMALLLPGVPDSWDPQTDYVLPRGLSYFGSCFTDMVNEGRLSEAEVDSFNIPVYFPNFQEMKAIIEKTDSYNIERMEILIPESRRAWPTKNAMALFCRAAFEGWMLKHFHPEIVDELFHRWEKKLASSSLYVPDNDKSITLFIILKRNN